MEIAILITAGIFALVILYFNLRRLVDAARGSSPKSSCNCGNCSESCAIREVPDKSDGPRKE